MNRIDSLRKILEFYKELDFERLPLNYSSQQSVVNNQGIKRIEPFKQKTTVSGSISSNSHKEALLNTLRDEIGDCQRCKLSKGRTHIVFGEGNVNARIMFIGEAPGREEDLQARPFVGDAGQLLTKLINKMGFERDEVYIANIVKCRPPMNRDPQMDEISTCLPFLERQIEIILPDVIMSLGKISTYTLLEIKGPISKFSITKVRGRFYEYKGIPVMPTFHPAYLLRNPKDKWLTWEDAQAVLKRIGH
ncbi:uracil-DNA glycosylase [Dissulfurispira thermophila]|uniref:Type-4 uracil-DNA glycosylase n=1 Tax=Dissulfurispira thermophila TaxID=2715679 RepID=A0A7G1H291_9BACT|nr:uracil-DNA glycosylase [Dissulfurispira thermophila]BCB96924.1 uracil-DNA glycosylase [Dissulfurispira thermophila]